MKSPRIFDFQQIGGNIKRMVEADVFFRDAMVLEDPLQDARAHAARVSALLQTLKGWGPKLREDVDLIAAKSSKTLELLRKGLAADKLKTLKAMEAQATAELEAAKEMLGRIQLADGAVVKAAAEAGRLLHLAQQQVEGVTSDAAAAAAAAAAARKSLRTLQLQLSHTVASSGAEMQSSVQHMLRAEQQLLLLTKAFQEGMKQLKQRKLLLQLVEEADHSLQLVEDEVRTLVGLGLAAAETRKQAAAAAAARDALRLQQLLLRAGDGAIRVREAAEAAETLFAESNLRVQAVEAMVGEVEDASLKATGAAAAAALRTRQQQLKQKVQLQTAAAGASVAAVKEELEKELDVHLAYFEQALQEGDAWMKQASQQHKMLQASLIAREEEAAAARNAADQFNKSLLESIEEAQSKVTNGLVQWSTIEKEHDFETRRAAAERFAQEAAAAAARAAAAVRSAERQAADFFKEAAHTGEDLKRLELKVLEVAAAATTQQEKLLQEKERLERAGAAAAAQQQPMQQQQGSEQQQQLKLLSASIGSGKMCCSG
ncbi:myosin heavy chain, putative [Eimeria brunetti]|uniref:Myosin heavy chain, putative n=1 Tax=Eimeria brunetti TaxID=51314 RepID=U6LP78_9EIME|nr:myosin heavy chain, putative [Eimeria brunetti]